MRIGICTNVGADTETEYGEYFSWGDTIGRNKNGTVSHPYPFSKLNYNAGASGSGHNLTGDFTQGDSNYDAARANMGEPYMMPTEDQCNELINNTDHEWTSINGVNGRKFINKTDSSKYIFLPTGGLWYHDYPRLEHVDVGEYGQFWTTIFDKDLDYRAVTLMISSSNPYTTVTERQWGISVHAIAPARPW